MSATLRIDGTREAGRLVAVFEDGNELGLISWSNAPETAGRDIIANVFEVAMPPAASVDSAMKTTKVTGARFDLRGTAAFTEERR